MKHKESQLFNPRTVVDFQGLEELEKSHTVQQNSVQSELKKEMALLQKRILMDMVWD